MTEPNQCIKCKLFPICLGEPQEARKLSQSMGVCVFCGHVFRWGSRRRVIHRDEACYALVENAETSHRWRDDATADYPLTASEPTHINVSKVCNNALCMQQARQVQEQYNAAVQENMQTLDTTVER